MANSAYWFRHDTNAKDDYKVMLLMDQLGLEGYGIFWVLLEVLREQDGYLYPVAMLPVLAKRYGSSAEKFRTVVMNYGLFDVLEDNTFVSPSLLRRMGEYDKYCDQRRIAGSKGGLKKVAHAKHMLSKDVAPAKQPSSKPVASGEERRGEERTIQEEIKKEEEKSPADKKIFNPGFSENFMIEVWPFYLSAGKAKYKNLDSQGVALKMLYRESGGNEKEAINALQYAVANGYQGFQWYFKHKTEANNGNARSNKNGVTQDQFKELIEWSQDGKAISA